MNKTFYTLLLIMSLTLTSCITTRSTVKINKIELGMTKEDITSLLGKPKYRNAWAQGEQWGYNKTVGTIDESEKVLLVICFDANGRVAEFETQKEFPRIHRH